jgi:hypothetical protein
VGLALVLGGAGIVVATGWALESERAAVVANRLARSRTLTMTRLEPRPAWVTPPDRKWWKSTPQHLTYWAMEHARTASASDPASVEEVKELLEAAVQAAPLEACARFALAHQGEGEGVGVGKTPQRRREEIKGLSLSRDVIALAWTGHQRHAAGRREAALSAYRAALSMAATADLERLAAPEYDGDSQIRRYALPAEDLIVPIVRDMAEHEDWTYSEWSAALPDFAVVKLAAVRVLRARSSPDAGAALDALLAQAQAQAQASPPPGAGAPAAIHVAALAEALALKGRWEEAHQRYRQAIDLVADPTTTSTTRRSWWMNVAEVALRLNDESSRQKALEAAKGMDPNDEITRRAVEFLKFARGRAEPLDPQAAREMTANGSR